LMKVRDVKMGVVTEALQGKKSGLAQASLSYILQAFGKSSSRHWKETGTKRLERSEKGNWASSGMFLCSYSCSVDWLMLTESSSDTFLIL
jgi:hypothetical protein